MCFAALRVASELEHLDLLPSCGESLALCDSAAAYSAGRTAPNGAPRVSLGKPYDGPMPLTPWAEEAPQCTDAWFVDGR